MKSFKFGREGLAKAIGSIGVALGAVNLFERLDFVKILSIANKKSHIQKIHLDFVPKIGAGQSLYDAYEHYFKESISLGCCHLSVLHMPMGGYFTFLECDFLSGAQKILKYLETPGGNPQFFNKSSMV